MVDEAKIAADAKRLDEIAEELEQMASGYLEKGARLHHEAARNRAVAAYMRASLPATERKENQ